MCTRLAASRVSPDRGPHDRASFRPRRPPGGERVQGRQPDARREDASDRARGRPAVAHGDARGRRRAPRLGRGRDARDLDDGDEDKHQHGRQASARGREQRSARAAHRPGSRSAGRAAGGCRTGVGERLPRAERSVDRGFARVEPGVDAPRRPRARRPVLRHQGRGRGVARPAGAGAGERPPPVDHRGVLADAPRRDCRPGGGGDANRRRALGAAPGQARRRAVSAARGLAPAGQTAGAQVALGAHHAQAVRRGPWRSSSRCP